MKFKFYKPHKLRGLVHAIWKQQAGAMDWQILPSGFVELIFMLGPAVPEVEGKRVGGKFNPTRSFCFLSGLHTKPLYLSFPRFETMGVQMHPLAIKAIFGIPCSELRDWAVDGELILDDMERIEQCMKAEGDFLSKARYMEDYLFELITESEQLKTALKMKRTLEDMSDQMARGTSVDPEEFTGYSRSHTHRLFTDWFGLSARQCLNLHQFLRSMHSLHLSSKRLTDIALMNGYYDQSHFIRNFRKYTNMTPGKYRDQKTNVPGQLPL